MGNQPVKPMGLTPLQCVLKYRKELGFPCLKKKTLLKLCKTTWPLYVLEGGIHWPSEGSFDRNVILKMNAFCRQECKYEEQNYLACFYALINNPAYVEKCKISKNDDKSSIVTQNLTSCALERGKIEEEELGEGKGCPDPHVIPNISPSLSKSDYMTVKSVSSASVATETDEEMAAPTALSEMPWKKVTKANLAEVLPEEGIWENACQEDTSEVSCIKPCRSDTSVLNSDCDFFPDSSFVENGYSVVTLSKTVVLMVEASNLSAKISAQKAERKALCRAMKLAEGQRVKGFTESKYVFPMMLPVRGHMWNNSAVMYRDRGKRGKEICLLLQADWKPKGEIQCKVHKESTLPEVRRYFLTDSAAEAASVLPSVTANGCGKKTLGKMWILKSPGIRQVEWIEKQQKRLESKICQEANLKGTEVLLTASSCSKLLKKSGFNPFELTSVGLEFVRKNSDSESRNVLLLCCVFVLVLSFRYVQKNLPQEVDIRTTPGFANYRFCSFETGESSRSGFIYPNAKLSVCQQQLTSNQHNKIN